MISYCLSSLISWLTPVAAAIVIVVGNLYLNVINRRRTAAEEHRKHLYSLLALASEYWTSSYKKKGDKELLEARLVAGELAASSQAEDLKAYSPRLKVWYAKTDSARLELMDALTGGCFQQSTWSPDPARVSRAAKAIAQITNQLTRAS